MGQPKRLLFVANAGWFFASHRLPVAEAARAAGYDVHIAAEPTGADPILAAGFPFHPLPLERSATRARNELRLTRHLVALYRELAPAIVHHVTLKPMLYGSLAARRARIPWIVNAVSGMGTLVLARGARARIRQAVVMPLLRLGSHRPNVRAIFQNADDRSAFIAAGIVDARQARLMRGSGVPLDLFRPSPEPGGVPVVVLPARLIADKGIHEFVAAARLLRQRGVQARLVLAGGLDPQNASALSRDDVSRWVTEGSVEWWGHRDDMWRVYAESTLVCLPSYREGLPRALQEAAASGLPVVTTDVPGCRDAVIPGETALLVPARDAQALAGALESLLQDRGRREAMGRAGRTLAEREFSVVAIAHQHVALFRELAAP